MIYSVDTEVNVKPLTWVYAHGELETFLGYDCIATETVEIYERYHQVFSGLKDSDIVETKAMNKDGETVDIVIYLWFSGIMRGLAVCVNDADAVTYAETQSKVKVSML